MGKIQDHPAIESRGAPNGDVVAFLEKTINTYLFLSYHTPEYLIERFALP